MQNLQSPLKRNQHIGIENMYLKWFFNRRWASEPPRLTTTPLLLIVWTYSQLYLTHKDNFQRYKF